MHSLTALSQRSPRAIAGTVRASTAPTPTQALLTSRCPRSRTHASHPDGLSSSSSSPGGGRRGPAAAAASISGQEEPKRTQSADDEEVRGLEQAPM